MKKFSKCMAVFATLALLSSLFFSCKQEPDEPVVSEISVALKEQGKIFFAGDELSKDDVVVTALYSDGKTRDVTNRAEFTPVLPATLNESFKLTAEYDEKTDVLQIKGENKDDYYKNDAGEYVKLKEILLALKDSDKKFFEGDTISKDDFVVTAKYEDDAIKTVTDGVTFEGITDEKLDVGKKTIKATFGSQSKSLEITVHKKDATVESISIALKPGKTYIEGETIYASDFTVTAKFSDETEETVTSKAEFTGVGATTTAGKVGITVTYESKTATCEVTVQAKTLTSISLSLKSSKTFFVGDTISESDFTVTAAYNNGTTEDVTSKAQFTGIGKQTQSGKVVIKATYGTQSKTLEITVREKDAPVASISLKQKPGKTFFVGDTISKSDFIVTAIYSDTFEENVTSKAEFSGLEDATATAGKVTITATYEGKSGSCEITVEAKPDEEKKLVSISLEQKQPGKTYVVGETISESDFIVTAIYDDKSREDVTSASQFKGLGTTTEAGKVTITATYSSKTASIIVQVLIPETLYIYDYDVTDENWKWEEMQVAKEGSCFYYEFKRDATIQFCISTSRDRAGQIGGGVAIPQTGDYVELRNYNNEDTILFFITNLEDRLYIRYEEGIYYARYAAKDAEVDLDGEINSVPNIIFDIGFDDGDNTGLSDWPEYMLEGDGLEIEIKEWLGSAQCTYEYQWYRYNSDVWENIDNANTQVSPNFEKGYFYGCMITATSTEASIGDQQYVIAKEIPRFYIDSKDFDVSLSESAISLNNAETTKDLWVSMSNEYCDSINWKSSDPFTVALDGYNNAFSKKTFKVTLRANGNGEATITVTVTRRGVERSFTCTVTVNGLNEVETEKYSWWYYVLDTSDSISSQTINLIFNNPNEYNPQNPGGDCKTLDLEKVQSKGEIFYKWNGYDNELVAEVDKSNAEAILQEADTVNKLAVYVCIPDKYPSVNLYAWDVTSTFLKLPNKWPGVKMEKCIENLLE